MKTKMKMRHRFIVVAIFCLILLALVGGSSLIIPAHGQTPPKPAFPCTPQVEDEFNREYCRHLQIEGEKFVEVLAKRPEFKSLGLSFSASTHPPIPGKKLRARVEVRQAEKVISTLSVNVPKKASAQQAAGATLMYLSELLNLNLDSIRDEAPRADPSRAGRGFVFIDKTRLS